MERNSKAGQNPPRVVAPIEEEEQQQTAFVPTYIFSFIKTLGAPRVGTGEGNRLNFMNMVMAAVTCCCYRILCDFVSV